MDRGKPIYLKMHVEQIIDDEKTGDKIIVCRSNFKDDELVLRLNKNVPKIGNVLELTIKWDGRIK